MNNKISRKSKLSVVKLTTSIIREHNNICNDILKYDKFWKSFFFALTYTIIPLNLMLLQQLLLDDIMPITVVIYSLFGIMYLISHIVLNLISASVNKNATKSHKFLFRFQTKFLSLINVKQKIKVKKGLNKDLNKNCFFKFCFILVFEHNGKSWQSETHCRIFLW